MRHNPYLRSIPPGAYASAKALRDAGHLSGYYVAPKRKKFRRPPVKGARWGARKGKGLGWISSEGAWLGRSRKKARLTGKRVRLSGKRVSRFPERRTLKRKKTAPKKALRVGREDYEERLEERRDRLEERATKAAVASQAAYKAEHAILDNIPMGQPILVGHHSERGHRSDLKRADRLMRKHIAEADKAADLSHRAEVAGRRGISSDDPQAIRKLKTKLAGLEEDQADTKKANALVRKAGRALGYKKLSGGYGKDFKQADAAKVLEKAVSLGLREGLAEDLREHFRVVPYQGLKFDTTNPNANIRNIKKRIAYLEQEGERELAAPVYRGGLTVEERADLNRIALTFPGRPPKETTKWLRSNGWRWSRREGAWLIGLHGTGRYRADEALKRFGGAAKNPRLRNVGYSSSPRKLYVVQQARNKLYVGSSGKRRSRSARLTGRRRYDLEPSCTQRGRKALRAERRLANRLRSKGYKVRQNPDPLKWWRRGDTWYGRGKLCKMTISRAGSGRVLLRVTKSGRPAIRPEIHWSRKAAMGRAERLARRRVNPRRRTRWHG